MTIFESGTFFARYEIVGILGAGSAADVYEVVAPDGDTGPSR